jgi:AraC-like DNA-binding protein
MLDSSLFFIFGISIAIFLSVLLLIQPQRTQANTILSAWLFLIAFHITLYVVARTNDLAVITSLAPLGVVLPMVEGIFLYAYTAALTNQVPRRKSAWLLHLVVPCIFLVWMIPFMMMPKEQQMTIFRNKGAGYEVFLITDRIAVVASMLGYTLWAQVLLRRHRRNILNEFSNTDKITLNWLQYLIYGFGIVFLAVLYQGGNWIIYSAITAVVLFIGFFGIRQVGILTPLHNTPIPEKLPSLAPNEEISHVSASMILPEHEAESLLPKNTEAPDIAEEKKKYAKSGLTVAMAEEYHSKLRQAMQKRKLFTYNELTLSTLADELGILPNHLSQIINEREGKTFYDYVNELRIEEFKRRVALPENSNLTLLAVAFDCGFNSKSSFNRCFKKVMNCSPSEYLEKMNIPSHP